MADIKTINGLGFESSISSSIIEEKCFKVAMDLNTLYREETKPVHVICVLNGAMMFCSELMKYFTFPMILDTVKIVSYNGTQSGRLEMTKKPDLPITKDEKILIVEDIVDTGQTIDFMLKYISKANIYIPVTVATLLLKNQVFEKNHKLDEYPAEIYYGMKIKNDFVVGFGLDYDGLGRNLNGIYKLIQ